MRAQLQRVSDPAGALVLLMLEHPALSGGTAHVACDTRDWVIDGVTWVGMPFRFTLPGATAGQAPRAAIEIANAGRELSDELERLPFGAALQGTFMVVSRRTPSVIESQFSAPLSNVSVTTAWVTATLGHDEALRAPAVKLRFDPTTSPALFPG